MNTIADRLRYLREETTMTQKDLADKIGVTRATVAGYETGKSSISVEILIKYADIFDTTTDWITGRINNRNVKVSNNEDFEVCHDKKINLSATDMKNLEKALKIVISKNQ